MDTPLLDTVFGDRVRVVTERFETQGVVVGGRSSGRLLIQIDVGVFVEISRMCVEKLEKRRQ